MCCRSLLRAFSLFHYLFILYICIYIFYVISLLHLKGILRYLDFSSGWSTQPPLTAPLSFLPLFHTLYLCLCYLSLLLSLVAFRSRYVARFTLCICAAKVLGMCWANICGTHTLTKGVQCVCACILLTNWSTVCSGDKRLCRRRPCGSQRPSHPATRRRK